jgi:anti-sigma-K factor RskA
MSSSAQDQLHDLAAGYALDALTPEERREFEAHLRGCEDCRAAVEGLSDAVISLAYAAGADGPPAPAGLREAILEAARRERPNVVPLRPRRRTPWIASVAAAAALALGLGLWATLGTNGPSRPAQRLTLQGTSGTLYVNPSGHAFMSLASIRAAPPGKTYEIWVIQGGKPAPAGTFTHGGTVSLTRDVPHGATVAVTLEPAPGREAPTGKVLFQAQVPA